MSEASTLRRKLGHMEIEMSILKASLARAKGEEMATCSHCKTKSKVKNTTLLKFHGYVSPHGCNGGDYWNFKCYGVVCRKCISVTPSYYNDSNDSIFYDFAADHEFQFGEVLDVHLREHIGWFYMKGDILRTVICEARRKSIAA